MVETIAHYTDQALLLHDRLIGALLHRAERRHEQVFYRRGRAAVAAHKAGHDVGQAIETAIGWQAYEVHVDEAEGLVQSEAFDSLDHVDQHYPGIRSYAPGAAGHDQLHRHPELRAAADGT